MTYRVLDRKYDIILDLSLPDLGHPERPGLLDEVHHHYDPDRLYCIAASKDGGPACPGFMTVVKERGRLHARHVSIGERDESASESDLHLALKEHTAAVAERAGFPTHVEDLAKHRRRKTDVTIDGADGRKLGYEIQLSAITRGSVDKRTEIARADGLTPLWLVTDQNAMPIDRAPWARLEVQDWRGLSNREALPVRGGVKRLEMVPCEWAGLAVCPKLGIGRCGGWHGAWAPMGGLYYDDAIVQTAAGDLVPLYMERSDGRRGWHMWVRPADKAEFLQGRDEPVPAQLRARDVEAPDLPIIPVEPDDECHWGEESEYRAEPRPARDSGELIDASDWVSTPAPVEFTSPQLVDGFDVPGDLIAAKAAHYAADARLDAFSHSLPSAADIVDGRASISDGQRAELEAGRAEVRRLAAAVQGHPWWRTAGNRYEAEKALRTAARPI